MTRVTPTAVRSADRLRVPRSVFAAAVDRPQLKIGNGDHAKPVTFQKAAIQAVQAAAERHIVDLVRSITKAPTFNHKTITAADFLAIVKTK